MISQLGIWDGISYTSTARMSYSIPVHDGKFQNILVLTGSWHPDHYGQELRQVITVIRYSVPTQRSSIDRVIIVPTIK
jgi:hypothetical protein